MNKYIKFLAPFSILLIFLVFIYNTVTNGAVKHPGKPLYVKHCEQCHGEKGEGIVSLIPPLMKSDFAIANFDSLPCWIRNGIGHPILVNGKAFDQPMYGLELDEIQIANIISYMESEFLNTSNNVNSIWVKQRLENCN